MEKEKGLIEHRGFEDNPTKENSQSMKDEHSYKCWCPSTNNLKSLDTHLNGMQREDTSLIALDCKDLKELKNGVEAARILVRQINTEPVYTIPRLLLLLLLRPPCTQNTLKSISGVSKRGNSGETPISNSEYNNS